MPGFTGGPAYRTPFGKNAYLRSTKGLKRETYTCAKAAVATEEIDGFDQKVLQSGEWMALITSGDDEGKVGPYDESASDGRQTEANIVGVNDTFLPWQLLERDVEIAVTYDGTVVAEWTFYRDAGVRTAVDDTVRGVIAGVIADSDSLSITFGQRAEDVV